MTRTSPITIDDEVVSLARRFRKEALASLVTVLRDEHAPASARAQASAKLLEYSDGKPSQAKPITVADIVNMPDDLRQQLLEALLTHYMPGGFQALLKRACDEAVAQFAARKAALPRPNRFKRRAPVPPASNQPAIAIRARSSGDLAPPGAAYAEKPTLALQPPLNANSPFGGVAKPDNVVVLPGSGTPCGLRYGLVDDLPDGSSNGNGHLPWRRH